nr:GDP-fucose protein O-fucosyltransferase [Tanacetum cinerariifolium]
MLAFSGCYYGDGEKERKELGKIRKRWKTLHSNNPDKGDAHLHKKKWTLAPLRALFPNIHSKDTIATKDELKPFSTFSSCMAALDFIVCDESDMFVTNNNGNMAKILAARRRYFGHKLTIRPNAKNLYRMFLYRENTTWEEFSSRVRTHQSFHGGTKREVSDQDEDDDLVGPQFLQSVNETNVDDDPSLSESPELEELLSD